MTTSRLVQLLCAVPLLSLALNMAAWTQYGIDLPFFDDWRGYASGNIDSLDLGYLFTPVNDTLTPVGFALDAMAQRVLRGNAITYQLSSMLLVLGGLLWMQWRLLVHTLRDRVRAATCMLFTLPMLGPGSYWGRENMAYHQALPLLGVLGVLCLVLLPSRWRWAHVVCTFLIGLMSGLAYISGAFAVLAVGATLLVLACLPRIDGAARLRAHGVGVGLAGVVTCALQVYALMASDGSPFTHREYLPLALPIEPAYWFYLLGKVGRAALLPSNMGWLALSASLLLIALAVWLGIRLVAQARRQPTTTGGSPQALLVVYAVISGVVLSYLLIVAAGRTNMRPPDVDSALDVFAFGFQRFHHFWVTLLWPWLAAGLWTQVARPEPGAPHRSTLIIGGASACIVGLMTWAGAFAHLKSHQQQAQSRLGTIACIEDALQGPPPMFCSRLNLQDFTPAYLHGVRTRASFLRYFPMPVSPLGDERVPALYRLGDAPSTEVWAKLIPTGDRPDNTFAADNDPHVVMKTGRPQDMADCGLLEVSARMRPQVADGSQLYFRARGQPHFTEASSSWKSVAASPSEDVTVTFRLISVNGFEDVLRWDPVQTPQRLHIDALEVRCRAMWQYQASGAKDSDVL